MNNKITTQRIARLAVFTAAALILTLVENFLPPLLFFAPGVKVGLANAAVLAVLILLGPWDALIVLAAKLAFSLVFGNPTALLYAAPAGLASLGVQYLLYRFLFPQISLASISLTSAITHNAVQLFVASLIVKQSLFYILPLTLIASVLAGLFIGFTVFFTVKYLPKKVVSG